MSAWTGRDCGVRGRTEKEGTCVEAWLCRISWSLGTVEESRLDQRMRVSRERQGRTKALNMPSKICVCLT